MSQYWEVPYNLPRIGQMGGSWTDMLPNICNNSWLLPSYGSLVDVNEACNVTQRPPGEGVSMLTENNIETLYVTNTLGNQAKESYDDNRVICSDASMFMKQKCWAREPLSEGDIILKGSVTDTAYFYADIEVDNQQQSVIVDSGSSLLAFPCHQCNTKRSNFSERDQIGEHIYPVYCVGDEPGRYIPCASSCEACFLHKSRLDTTRDELARRFCDKTEAIVEPPPYGTAPRRYANKKRQARFFKKRQTTRHLQFMMRPAPALKFSTESLFTRFDEEATSKHRRGTPITTQFIDHMSDADRGSFQDFLFFHQSDIRQWSPSSRATSILQVKTTTGEDAGLYDICNSITSDEYVLSTVESPSLSGGRCGYEISYAEGSSLRGYYYVSTITNGNYSLQIIHGCTTLETHLFKDQEANGIMGLEFWSSSNVESLFSSVFRKYFLPHAQKGSWYPVGHVCFSGQGGVMRLGSHMQEYWVEPKEHGYEVSDSDISPVIRYVNKSVRQSNTIGMVGLKVNDSGKSIQLLPPPSDTMQDRIKSEYEVNLFKDVADLWGLYHWMSSPMEVSKSATIEAAEKEGFTNRLGPKRATMGHSEGYIMGAIPTLVDSGTTLSAFPKAVYEQLLTIIDSAIDDFNTAPTQYRDLSETDAIIPVTIEDINEESAPRLVLRETCKQRRSNRKKRRRIPDMVLEQVPKSARKRRRLDLGDTIISSNRDTCWYFSGDFNRIKNVFPRIKMEFLNGVERIWTSEDYLYERGSKWHCLSIEPLSRSKNHEIKLGMTFFQGVDVGFYVRYDKEMHMLSEASAISDKYRETAQFTLQTAFMGNVSVGLSMNEAHCPSYKK